MLRYFFTCGMHWISFLPHSSNSVLSRVFFLGGGEREGTGCKVFVTEEQPGLKYKLTDTDSTTACICVYSCNLCVHYRLSLPDLTDLHLQTDDDLKELLETNIVITFPMRLMQVLCIQLLFLAPKLNLLYENGMMHLCGAFPLKVRKGVARLFYVRRYTKCFLMTIITYSSLLTHSN